MFGVLELNPFPFIMMPYEVGHQWSWTLKKIGSFYGDPRWGEWEGTIDNVVRYEITDEIVLGTRLGDLDCFVIEAVGRNPLGESHLTAYFNMRHGFVRLDYINIDSSKLVMELVSVSSVFEPGQ